MPQLTLGVIVGYVIEVMKGSDWFPWMHTYTDRVNRLVSLVLAVVASLGIQYTYDATTGTLVLSGLTLSSLVPVAWEAVKQFVANEVAYKVVVKR